jgi:hypothetical protein
MTPPSAPIPTRPPRLLHWRPPPTGIASGTRGRSTQFRLPTVNDLPGVRSPLRKGSRDDAGILLMG